jgi:hypothetical protein
MEMTMGKTEAFEAERFTSYLATVEELAGAPVNTSEQAEVNGWFRLGAPAAHAAVSIKASRLISQPPSGDA